MEYSKQRTRFIRNSMETISFKRNTVESITVSGAGKEYVNGVYNSSGKVFGDTPMFTRFADHSNQQIMMFSGDGLGFSGVGIFYKRTY